MDTLLHCARAFGLRALLAALAAVSTMMACGSTAPSVPPAAKLDAQPQAPVPRRVDAQDMEIHNTPVGYWVGKQPPWKERAREPYFPNPHAAAVAWPEAPPQSHGLDLTQRDRATAERYFDWLCTYDATVDIRRKVEKVEGFLFMRPQLESLLPLEKMEFLREKGAEGQRPYNLNFDRSYLESPAVDRSGNQDYPLSSMNDLVQATYKPREAVARGIDDESHIWFVHSTYAHVERLDWDGLPSIAPRFRRLEWALPKDARFLNESDGKRYLLWPKGKIPRPNTVLAYDLKSRYGVTWRGIVRSPYDREMNIAGAEILVFDLQTNELLGFMRTYVKTGDANVITGARADGVQWAFSKICKPKSLLSVGLFWRNILKPLGI